MTRKKAEPVANRDEVLAQLTRILRREESDSVILTDKRKERWMDEDGHTHMVEQSDSRVVQAPPKLADVNKAAELLGRYYSLYNDKQAVVVDLPVIINDTAGVKDG